MKITVESREPGRAAVELLAVATASLGAKTGKLPGRLAALDRLVDGRIAQVVKAGDFTGAANQSLVLVRSGRGGPRRIALFGLGAEEKVDAESLRRFGGNAVAQARKLKARSLAIALHTSRKLPAAGAGRASAEGAVLASYRSDGWKTEKQDGPAAPGRVAVLVSRDADLRTTRAGVELGEALAEAQNLARKVSNEPPNVMNPAAIAREARRLARETTLRCKVLEVAEMKKRGMGALLAVGQGSSSPPRLIVLEHRPKRGRQKICIVGKGITYDSGGISIKPSPGMQDMKHDMSGAATVLGLMHAVSGLDLPLHVVGVIAAAENMPSGGAYRPGDILTSMSGKTIEIQNTDAEGRLVLADALHYARTQYEPDAMIDLATLTGACVVALGGLASGLFGSHEGLISAIRDAGVETGERAWPMPLWDGHRDLMRSEIADLKNVGGRDAGADTAAAFLSSFVGDVPWAHLDIAGTAWTGKSGPYQPYGATGVGVRMLAELLLGWPRGGLA